MNTINDGGPAFPSPAQYNANGDVLVHATPGMSYRAYVAAKMMAKLLDNTVNLDVYPLYARDAVLAADSLIAELAKGAK